MHQVLENIKNIYNFPVKFLRECMLCYFNDKNTINHHIKLLEHKEKKQDILLYFQIINSRSTFYCNLSKAFSDKQLINCCEPISLIEIGGLAKKLHDKRISDFSSGHIRKEGFIKKIKISNPNKEIVSNSNKYSILNITRSYNNNIDILIQVCNTSVSFNICANDLLKDNHLLNNTSKPDLINLGFQTQICN